jgi:hypothetical protein
MVEHLKRGELVALLAAQGLSTAGNKGDLEARYRLFVDRARSALDGARSRSSSRSEAGDPAELGDGLSDRTARLSSQNRSTTLVVVARGHVVAAAPAVRAHWVEKAQKIRLFQKQNWA